MGDVLYLFQIWTRKYVMSFRIDTYEECTDLVDILFPLKVQRLFREFDREQLEKKEVYEMDNEEALAMAMFNGMEKAIIPKDDYYFNTVSYLREGGYL